MSIGGYIPTVLTYSYIIDGKKDVNRAELIAIYVGLLLAPNKKIQVLTDSQSALYYIVGNHRNNKYNKVLDCINYLSDNKFKNDIIYTKVKAHEGIIGNEIADSLAKHASKEYDFY
jgi:ribonuclease HI